MNTKNKKGFTIIELIVVIAIIAILAAIVMVNVVQYIGKSKDANVQADIDTIKTNAGAYDADITRGHGAYTGFDVACASGASWTSTTPCNVNKTAEFDNVITAITNNDAGSVAPVSAFLTTTWCVSAPLTGTTGDNWCADSTGSATMGVASSNTCNTSTGLCGAPAS